MATREANAIGNADYEPIGMNYKVFYITLPKSALGDKIPFVRHSPLWYPGYERLAGEAGLSGSHRLSAPSDGRYRDAAGRCRYPSARRRQPGGAELQDLLFLRGAQGHDHHLHHHRQGGRQQFLQDRRTSCIWATAAIRIRSGYVTGTQNPDGTTTFVYTVNAERQGSYTPATVGFSDNSWDTSQSYFLNVPNFDGTFDASAFTDGVYDLFGYADTKNGVIPVDAGATLTVSGDTDHHPVCHAAPAATANCTSAP